MKNSLGSAPEKALQLNKKFILLLAGLMLVVLLIILLSSFSKPAIKEKNPIPVQSTQTTMSPSLNALPNNYQDTQKIQAYLNPAPPTPVIPAAIQNELSSLENSQSQLQVELASLKSQAQKPSNQALIIDSPDTLTARKSNIFFNGEDPVKNNESSMQANTNFNSANNSSVTQNAYEAQNMQGQKIDFMQQADSKDIYNPHNLIKPASPFEVQAGTIIPTVLLTAVNTSLPGAAVAQIKEDIYDSVTGKSILIPKGSKVLGQYDSKIAYGQERILMVFNRIIMPDGSSIQLSNFNSADLQGSSGIAAKVDNHWSRILGAATISTVLSLGAGAASDNMDNNNVYYHSSEQNAVLGAANNISNVGQSLTNRAINIQPTLTIPAGFQFNIIVNKDMILKPYHDAS